MRSAEADTVIQYGCLLICDFYLQLGPCNTEEVTEAAEEEEETLEKWRLARMEKEKWMQEFEKKQSRKRGYEEVEEDMAGEMMTASSSRWRRKP